jgi:broad specificity phosphatase PhoE
VKLYVARHGRTNYNDLGLSNADPTVDVHLTDAGKLQAQTLAEKLKAIPFDHIYVSQLKRTQQTLQFVQRFQTAPATIDARLNDIRTGYEGRHSAEYYKVLATARDQWTAHFNGGESFKDVSARIQSFLDDLRTQNHQTVLIMTSQVLVQLMSSLLNHLPYEEALAAPVEQGSYVEMTLPLKP